MPMFVDIEYVNDIMGRYSSAKAKYIVSGGKFDPVSVRRLISEKSDIINAEHGMNFQPTTITNEYHDSVGDRELITDKWPIISITKLSIWDGSEYLEKTQSVNPDVGDFYIHKADSGMIRFHTSPDSGHNRILIDSYTYGYSSIPGYIRECCGKLVGIELALQLLEDEECKDLLPKWRSVIKQWFNRTEYILNNHVRNKQIGIHSLGKSSEYIQTELDRLLSGYNR